MRAKFADGGTSPLQIVLEPEGEAERLLLQQFVKARDAGWLFHMHGRVESGVNGLVAMNFGWVRPPSHPAAKARSKR